MARIDTLPHFLTDVADAIRSKTGEETAIEAADFDTEIGSIAGGVEVQNGTKVNYKAYTGTVPAGTFVKLKNIASYATVTNTIDKASISGVLGLLKINNKVVLHTYQIGGSYTSTYHYLTLINATDSSFTRVEETTANSYGGSSYTSCMLKLDDTHFALWFGQTYMKVYEIVDNRIVQVSTFSASTYQYPSSNVTSNWVITEDTDYWYLHTLNIQTSSSNHNCNLYAYKIAKTDYTISYVTNTFISDLYSDTKLASINNKVLIFCRSYSSITEGNNKLKYVRCTFNGSTYSSSGAIAYKNNNVTCVRVFYAQLNNRYFVLYSTDGTDLKFIEVNSSGEYLNEGTLLENTTRLTTNTYAINNIIDSNLNIFTYKPAGDTSAIVAKYLYLNTDNELVLGNDSPLCDSSVAEYENQLTSNSNNIIKLNNNYLVMFNNSIGIFEDNENLLEPIQESSVVVLPATGTIQGLTNTDCTTETAGEVYLLDTNS